MKYSLSAKPYLRSMAKPLKMSRGTISQRDGVLLRLKREDGAVAFGEAVTMPYFHTESSSEALHALRRLSPVIDETALEQLQADVPAARFALDSAFVALASEPALGTPLNISFLLESGSQALEQARTAVARGYRTFKWKIGVHPPAEESAVFTELLMLLPAGVALRLDANGGLSAVAARAWSNLAANTCVEFIEQPLPADAIDALLALQADSPTPIALDESVAGINELRSWSSRGWAGVYVVKPSRLQSLSAFLRWRAEAHRRIVYSSALETSVGTEMGLRLAASDLYNHFAVGYGVAHWFVPDGLDVHPVGPQLTPGAVGVPELELVWSRL